MPTFGLDFRPRSLWDFPFLNRATFQKSKTAPGASVLVLYSDYWVKHFADPFLFTRVKKCAIWPQFWPDLKRSDVWCICYIKQIPGTPMTVLCPPTSWCSSGPPSRRKWGYNFVLPLASTNESRKCVECASPRRGYALKVVQKLGYSRRVHGSIFWPTCDDAKS